MNTDYSIKLLSHNNRSMNGKIMESIIKHIDISELKERIHTFQNLNVQSLSDKSLKENIDKVLRVKLDRDTMISTILTEYSLFDIGTRFYRVRKLKNSYMPNRCLKNISAYWNPPQKYVKYYGRLNKPGESLLYTALNPYTAICETNLKAGDSFVLCVYEAIKPLRFSWIGGKANYEFNGIRNKKTIEFYEMIREFLVNEFTRIIPENQDYLYRITEMIAKNYYTYPDDSGWRYPSVKHNFEDNICFKSERIMYNLKLVGAIVAKFNEDKIENPQEMKMSVEYIIIGPNMDNYYAYQSKEVEKYIEKLFYEFLKE